jgi:hypothetical protein
VGKYIDSWEMIRLSAKAFIFGVVTSFLAFSMIADDFVSNIFGLIFINAVICSNLFVLLIGTPPLTQITPRTSTA